MNIVFDPKFKKKLIRRKKCEFYSRISFKSWFWKLVSVSFYEAWKSVLKLPTLYWNYAIKCRVFLFCEKKSCFWNSFNRLSTSSYGNHHSRKDGEIRLWWFVKLRFLSKKQIWVGKSVFFVFFTTQKKSTVRAVLVKSGNSRWHHTNDSSSPRRMYWALERTRKRILKGSKSPRKPSTYRFTPYNVHICLMWAAAYSWWS